MKVQKQYKTSVQDFIFCLTSILKKFNYKGRSLWLVLNNSIEIIYGNELISLFYYVVVMAEQKS